MKANIADAIIDTAEALGQPLSPGAVKVFVAVLDGIPEAEIQKALILCAKELKGRLTPAEVLSRIDDGRPGSQEAWAMMPTSEDQTVVWTPEMAAAWAIAEPLMYRDKIAARQTFLEAYAKRVMEARNARRPVIWTASLGTDPAQRETALRDAVERGRLSLDRAHAFLPNGAFLEQAPQLEHENKPKLEHKSL